jgi:hypothetical protein
MGVRQKSGIGRFTAFTLPLRYSVKNSLIVVHLGSTHVNGNLGCSAA